ncbi:hypothetical protein HAX54_020241 [Datura stramonium]|uniref:Uncharacterized protein n=1 Tax=Datura stramonium TaxID=4076 RepID=A0ABS8UQV7_DATST|nr:hypothetical protein [Datura stramonium]
MQAAKEKAANMAASAKSGMEKTKATLEEKAERMRTRDPLKKEMATEKKDDKKTAAELNKREANDQNAAARHGGAQGYTTMGAPEYSTTAYDPTDDTTGGGVPVLSDHPTAKSQDPSFPC